jgi:phosphoglycerate dehydrogenase-like enzyme
MLSASSLVICTMQCDERHRQRLQRVFSPASVRFIEHHDRKAIADSLNDAEVALLRGAPNLEAFLDRKLRWVHCDQSGLDAIATPELVASPVSVTSAAGRSAPVLAEHALMFMLAVSYRFRDLGRAQRWRNWASPKAANLRGLYGKNVLIIGMGHTASTLATYCSALGMSVTAFRRKDCPSDIANIKVASAEAGDDLDALLPSADFLVLAASLNDTSHDIIHSKRIDLLKSGSYVINVARGALVDERALARAIRSGVIAGAGLDVAEEEPQSSIRFGNLRTLTSRHIPHRKCPTVLGVQLILSRKT